MALIKCPDCQRDVSETAAKCPQCGRRIASARWVYIVLALFLGVFGIHNFVAGFNRNGAIQLGMCVLSPVLGGLPLLLLFLWILYDVFCVTEDSTGRKMA